MSHPKRGTSWFIKLPWRLYRNERSWIVGNKPHLMDGIRTSTMRTRRPAARKPVKMTACTVNMSRR
jgi:hypothetical protein